MDKYVEVKKFIVELVEINKNERNKATEDEELQFLRGEAMAYKLILEKMKRDIDNAEEKES